VVYTGGKLSQENDLQEGCGSILGEKYLERKLIKKESLIKS
jgi:hypothetical protein